MTQNKSHGRLSISASAKPRPLMEDPTLTDVWTANILTLYPEMFPGVLGHSLTGRALKDGLWQLKTTDIRQFATGKHRNVDDTPAGGGAGMVLRADVLGKAIDSIKSDAPILAMSPRGAPLKQHQVKQLSQGNGVTILCGRFEGIDQRVLDARGIQEVSIGDYILTGGELAAQVLIDACIRLIPRVLGNAESVQEESFSDGLLEHPQYTRPADWEGHKIPDVLLSGNHAKIAEWRKSQAEALTKTRRPDLWRAYQDDDTDPE
jgi:tRNA (guanine37-N1)-methyltransferase